MPNMSLLPQIAVVCSLVTASKAALDFTLSTFARADKKKQAQLQTKGDELRWSLRKAYQTGEISGEKRAHYERKVSMAVANSDCKYCDLSINVPTAAYTFSEISPTGAKTVQCSLSGKLRYLK